MFRLINRLAARIRGLAGRRQVHNIAEQFTTMHTTLANADANMGQEIEANAAQISELRVRNASLFDEQNRARRIRSKLAEFIA